MSICYSPTLKEMDRTERILQQHVLSATFTMPCAKHLSHNIVTSCYSISVTLPLEGICAYDIKLLQDDVLFSLSELLQYITQGKIGCVPIRGVPYFQ